MGTEHQQGCKHRVPPGVPALCQLGTQLCPLKRSGLIGGAGGAAVKTGLSVKDKDTTARIYFLFVCLFLLLSSSVHFTLLEPDVLSSGFLVDIASMAHVHNVTVCLSSAAAVQLPRENIQNVI